MRRGNNYSGARWAFSPQPRRQEQAMSTATASASVIERREFTFCSATYQAPLTFRKFLVMTPSKPEAERRAWEYARARWGEPSLVHVYPRNYVKRARALYAAGDHDGPGGNTGSSDPADVSRY